ncbi:hypothetical protein RG47T_4754 [Mucilaginibacter polytrichastri]|uniref:Uncharacterized protein n=1 Tax=Mucilaginibacter polytrichastri TaxID=1302689 RepID=A0A1Q6A5I3_9SPHI|nr:hypothetical protein RG47T_4754 [Mucilaginibacter polytrichastri]
MLLITGQIAFAQHIADSFQHAESNGYSMQALDKVYKSAVGAGDVVFKGDDEKRLITAYTTMLQDLNKYLNENNFRWNSPVRIFNRVYFEPDGSISYYLVNLKPTGLDEEKQKACINLLSKFIQRYKIKITASSKFAQCSPVIYEDVIKS